MLVVLLLPGAAAAQAVPPVAEVRPTRVETHATPEKVQLGEPFTYELVFTHPQDQRYELLTPKEPGDFELLEQQRRRDDVGGEAVTTFRLRMALFELGPHTLPPLAFEVATPQGAARFVAEGPTVEGLSSLSEDAEGQDASLRPLKATVDVPIRSWRLLWGLLGGLAAVALGIALWRWWRRPRPAMPAPAPPLLPLDVRTRKALDALQAEGLAAQGRHKEFYVRLTDIVRGYLAERYHVEARECTTAELLATLRRSRAAGLPAEALRVFLDEADLVKFAKMQVDATACDASLEFGHRLVNATSTPPVPPPDEAHAASARAP